MFFFKKWNLVILCFINILVLVCLFPFPSLSPIVSRTRSISNLRARHSVNNKMMKYGVITSARVTIPEIIYGTAWKKTKTQEYVEQAVRQGFRAIDTACQPKHYYEKGVGDALEQLYQQNLIQREDIFLQTKFTSVNGQDPNNIPYDPTAPLRDQVLQSFAKSCENLRTNYLDSLVMHSPMGTIADTLVVWKTFEELYKQGKVRYLGMSNTYQLRVLQTIYDSAEIKPTFLQNRFYRDSGYDYAIREFCREHSIYYQSFWTLTANPDILRSQSVTAMSKKYGKTREQIFFRFIQSLGMIPLSGTTSNIHMKEDIEVASTITLERNEIETIDNMLKQLISS